MSTSPPQAMEAPVLDQARQQKAREYARIHRYLEFGNLGLAGAILLVLLFGGLSVRLAGLFPLPVILRACVYFVVLTAGYEVLTSPMLYYGGFVLPRRFGLSKQRPGGWLADVAKSRLLSLVLGVGMVALVYWLITAFPSSWWLIGWGIMIVFVLLMTIVAPIIIVPLFFKMKPLADSDLKARLEQLARRAGAKIHGIYAIEFSRKVTSANAAMMGMGRTRRIVLSDTLLQQYTVPEIEVITAHELGHHLNRDAVRLLVIQSAIWLLGFYIADVVFKTTAALLGFSGISDVAAFPLLALIFGVFGFIVSPLLNTYTRHVEAQADGYALRLTDNPEAFIHSMTRLTNQNLSVARPGVWEELLLYDHPSYNRRVEHARHYTAHKSDSI